MVDRLVLASASPRRRELLERLGATIEVRPADVDETPADREASDNYVRRLALAKLAAVVGPAEVGVAADTIVVLDDQLLGKPADRDGARSMLRRLAGRAHHVVSGVAVHGPGGTKVATSTTTVVFTPIDDRTLDWYVATDEPYDKAGGYAIQGRGGLFVERIDGSFDNVIGLPMALTRSLLDAVGVDLLR